MRAVLLNEFDNVVIALDDLSAGETVCGVTLKDIVPRGFKFARRDLENNAPIVRYGCIIGYSTAPIASGQTVHTHNMGMGSLLERKFSFPEQKSQEVWAPINDQHFYGYVRANGKVGTRNKVLVLSNVNCSATVVHKAVEIYQDRSNWKYENVDGVVAVSHNRGCGIAAGTESSAIMARTMAGYLQHPNVGAVILVGLGCEKAQPRTITEPHGLIQLGWKGKDAVPDPDPGTVLVLSIQELGGTENTIAAIRQAIESVLPRVNRCQREKVAASHLKLATQCGGSDGLSGITANRLVGEVSDIIVRSGGSSFLTETSEHFGAEHILASRAKTPQVAREYLDWIRWYENYITSRDGSYESNPAFGNKEGGISTVAEKALGSIAKAGKSALSWVINHAEPIPGPGLGFMNGPAFDPAGATGQIASGANIMMFTTGRGSCFGSNLIPVVKIMTNTPTYRKMPRDMDINAGVLVEDGSDLSLFAWNTFQWLLNVASGQSLTWSESHGYGDREFVLWDTGPMT